MTKIVLNPVVGNYDMATVNTNFQKIAEALNEDVLYRDNPEGEPNTLEQNLDVNGKDIINVNSLGINGSVKVNGVDLKESVEAAAASAAAAAATEATVLAARDQAVAAATTAAQDAVAATVIQVEASYLQATQDAATNAENSATAAAASAAQAEAIAQQVDASLYVQLATTQHITGPKQFRTIREEVVTANSSTLYTVNCNAGNIFNLSLTANCTINFSNVPAAGVSYSPTFILKQDATGGRVITWPASVKWAGGGSFTPSTQAGKTDFVSLVTVDGGVTWFGFVSGKGY